MRKVLLSFLGTNNYIPCNYVCEGLNPVKNVRFVQEATIYWNCADWSNHDEIFIFSTDESHRKNWFDNGHNNSDGEVIQCEGLQRRISQSKTSARVSEVEIPPGRNEQEIWDIFSIVFEKINEGDELYFDITHAFRSLPILAMVIINYSKILNNISVKVIGYGAMEAIGTAWEVEKMDVEERDVPVFNLLPFDQLLDWATAIDKFVSAGDASSIQKLTKEKSIAFKKEVQRPDQEADGLKKMADFLGDFSKTLSTCRGKNIVHNASCLKKAIADVQHQQLIKPLAPLLEKLEYAVSKFSGDEVRDGIVAVKWCLDHNLTQQGFTLLQETMFTYILGQSTEENTGDIDKRNLVGKAVTIELNDMHFDEWDATAQNNKGLIYKIRDWLHPQEELLDNLRNLSNDRNDLNHAGMNKNPMSADKFNEKLIDYLAIFESETSINDIT